MELLDFDRDTVTLRLSATEFRDLTNAIFVIDQDFEHLDHVMLNVPLERIEALRDALSDALRVKAEFAMQKAKEAATIT